MQEARTSRQLSSAAGLIREYAASLGIDLGFQKFDQEMDEFPGIYARPQGRVILAVEDGEAVGVVALRRLSGRVCEMKRMYVMPEFSGKGIGRKLAIRVIKEAREAGYTRMRLDSLSRLKEAVSLYESLGFKRVKPYAFNPHKDYVCMELKL
jgi:putative acetyltransferase